MNSDKKENDFFSKSEESSFDIQINYPKGLLEFGHLSLASIFIFFYRIYIWLSDIGSSNIRCLGLFFY